MNQPEISIAHFASDLVPLPRDFEATYITLGKEKLEERYNVRTTTVNRWLTLVDEGFLKARRREFVRKLREQKRAANKKRPRLGGLRSVHDARKVDIRLVRMAADYLRIVRNGGWVITRSKLGDWRVGMKVLSSYQLVELAVAKGFDLPAAKERVRDDKANLQPGSGGRVDS